MDAGRGDEQGSDPAGGRSGDQLLRYRERLLGRLTRDWDEQTVRSQTDAVGGDLYQPGDQKIVEGVANIATRRGIPRAQVALAWLASRPVVTAPIIGATKPHHIGDAVAALDVVLADDEVQELQSAYSPHHPAGF